MGAKCSQCACNEDGEEDNGAAKYSAPSTWEESEVKEMSSPTIAQTMLIPTKQSGSRAPNTVEDVLEDAPSKVEEKLAESQLQRESPPQRENQPETVPEPLSLELELTFNVQSGKTFEVGFGEANYTTSSCIVVSEISKKSPLWNSASGGIGLREGDIVEGVNGFKGCPQDNLQSLLAVKQAGGSLKLNVRARLPTLIVTLKRKAGEELHIALDLGKGPTDPIRIGQCSRIGVIGDWNEEHATSWVAEGDVITKVNHVNVEPGTVLKAMSKAWKDQNAVTLTIETMPKLEERLK